MTDYKPAPMSLVRVKVTPFMQHPDVWFNSQTEPILTADVPINTIRITTSRDSEMATVRIRDARGVCDAEYDPAIRISFDIVGQPVPLPGLWPDFEISGYISEMLWTDEATLEGSFTDADGAEQSYYEYLPKPLEEWTPGVYKVSFWLIHQIEDGES